MVVNLGVLMIGERARRGFAQHNLGASTVHCTISEPHLDSTRDVAIFLKGNALRIYVQPTRDSSSSSSTTCMQDDQSSMIQNTNLAHTSHQNPVYWASSKSVISSRMINRLQVHK